MQFDKQMRRRKLPLPCATGKGVGGMGSFAAFILLWLILSTFIPPTLAQNTWTITQDCVAMPIAASAELAPAFDGTIFAYEPETGIRAFRSDMVTPYIVAFEGANFTGAAAISPDGQWIAIPSGSISHATLVDATYLVSEIRVQSTLPSTISITNRIPWHANFRGTERDLSVRDIQWLDNERLLYARDDWETTPDQTEFAIIDAFTGEEEPVTNQAMGLLSGGLSPDATHAFGLIHHRIALVNIETEEILADFTQPRGHLLAWSPDSTLAAVTRTIINGDTIENQLVIVDREGTVWHQITVPTILDFVWAGNSQDFALVGYADDSQVPTLYLGSTINRTLTDTCLSIRVGDATTGHGMIWSPDSSTLAVLFNNNDYPMQHLDVETLTLRPVELFNESGPSYFIAWG